MTRRDEELLALIFDPLEEAFAVGLDTEGGIVHWTAGARESLGYHAAVTLPKHVSELYTPEDVARRRPEADLREAAERGRVTRDGWRRRADGSRYWARTVVCSLRDPEGGLTGFAQLTLDSSDPLAVVLGPAGADPRLAGLIELSTDGMVATDQDGVVILFNRGAERMFGYERGEVVGRALRMLLAERDRDALDRHVRAFAEGGVDAGLMAAGRVVTGLAKDGTELPIEASMSRLELEHGAILCVILRDASERLATERALGTRDWLLRKVTHDLGNPVAAIVMVADRLLRTAPDPDRRQHTRQLLEGVTQQAQEMKVVIEELLDLRVLRTGKASLVQRAVEVADMLRKACSLVEPMAVGRRVAVEVGPPPDARVIADPVQLRHALVAFLSDAIGRSDEGASVRIAARADVEEVRFEIVGPALGVPGALVTSQLEEATEPREDGDAVEASLALLVGSEIVRGHGAHVVVDDGSGGETIYRFALPRG